MSIRHVCIAIVTTTVTLFSSALLAQTKLLLSDFERSTLIAHPLYGEVPNAPPQAYFQQQQRNDVQVALRATGVIDGQRTGTAFAFIIKNLSADRTISLKPVVDVVDGGNQVLQVLSYQQLTDAIKANPGQASGQGTFFAYGSQRFVTGALAGYAISSLIVDSLRTNNSKQVAFYQKHWLKEEYRIPPLAQVDANILLRGVPRLPLTTRLTIGEDVFAFVSPQTEAEAIASYAREQSDQPPASEHLGDKPSAQSIKPMAVPNAAAPVPAAAQAQTPAPSHAAGPMGQESYQVERMARNSACNADAKAILTAKGPGFETYTVACTNGDVLIARCEFGNCRFLK